MRLLLISIALLLTACSPSAEPPSDRLVILANGDVVTIDPDGSNPTTIASDAEAGFFQPVWSPDRSLLAFASTRSQAAVAVARLSDGETFTSNTDSFPFYFSWSERNELGILRNGDQGLNLETVTLSESGLSEPEIVAQGQPLYYSWNQDGSELVAHVGLDQLSISDGATEDLLAIAPGRFAAPAWTERGIFAVTEAGDLQSLVVLDRDGTAQTLASLAQSTNLIPNRDGSLVAIQTLGPQQQFESAAFQSAAFQTTARVAANRLVVLDTTTGETTAVTTAPVLAFFWSPADDSLLVLDVVDGPLARWSIWNDGAFTELVRFEPDQAFFTQFVPFFDQYAQSVSLWSPAGDAVAFPGTIDGRSGIWVQKIGGDPTWISEGTWVSWAP